MLRFLLSLIFPSLVLAAPAITITQTPSTVTADTQFTIDVSFSGLNANTDYRVKSLGTINDEDKLKTLGADGTTWLPWNGSWSDMPKITANGDGSASATIKSKFYDNASGTAVAWIRIRQDSGSTTNYDSGTKTVTVNPAPSPSPSSEPSSSTDPSSTPTPTPVPSQAPTGVLASPKPSKRPSPSPSAEPEESPSPEPSPKVLGVEASPSPSPEAKKSFALTKGALVSYSLVGSGLLFILGAGIPLTLWHFRSLRHSKETE